MLNVPPNPKSHPPNIMGDKHQKPPEASIFRGKTLLRSPVLSVHDKTDPGTRSQVGPSEPSLPPQDEVPNEETMEDDDSTDSPDFAANDEFSDVHEEDQSWNQNKSKRFKRKNMTPGSPTLQQKTAKGEQSLAPVSKQVPVTSKQAEPLAAGPTGESPVSNDDIQKLLELASALEQSIAARPNTEKSTKRNSELLCSTVRSIGRRAASVGFVVPKDRSSKKDLLTCKNCRPHRLTLEDIDAALNDPKTDLLDLINKDWHDSAFITTKVTRRSILTPGESARALLLSKSNPKDARVLEEMHKVFPGLAQAKQHLDTGDVVCLRNRDTIATYGSRGEDSSAGGKRCSPDMVLLAALLPRQMDATNSARRQEFRSAVLSLLSAAAAEGITELSVAAPADMEIPAIRKILELTSRVTTITSIEISAKGFASADRKAPKLPTTTSITLNPGSRSFAEVLGGLQTKLDPSKQGVRVSRPQKTQDGSIRLKISGATREATANFAESMGRESKLLYSIRQPSNTTSIIIRDLGELISVADLGEALTEVGFEPEMVTINPFKPTRAGDCSSIVRIPSGDVARALIKRGSLQVGWFSCRLDELVTVRQCLNCLSFDHTLMKCTLPPSDTKRCLKCGHSSHLAKDCTAPPHCYTCKTDGHFANSTECPSFRAKVQALRQQRSNHD